MTKFLLFWLRFYFICQVVTFIFLQLTVENKYLSDKDITTFTEKYANTKY